MSKGSREIPAILAPTAEDAYRQMGEVMSASLKRSGACVVLRRSTGQVTILDPAILDHIDDVTMAEHLLASWSEEEVRQYLSTRGPR